MAQDPRAARPAAARPAPILRARAVALLAAAAVLAGCSAAGSAAPAASGTAVGGPVLEVESLVLNIGADQSRRNLAWSSATGEDQYVQLAKAADAAGGAFPAGVATTVAATSGGEDGGRHYHDATLAGLEEGTRYLYRVGSDAAGWSRTHAFTTGDFGAGHAFLLFGDPQIGAGELGTDSAGWASTVRRATDMFPGTAFLMSAGDQVNEASDEAQYAGFLAPGKLAELPLATTIGNHDAGSEAYDRHFNMPNSGTARDSRPEGDYWFRYNGALYINLNSNIEDNAAHAAFVREVIAEQGTDEQGSGPAWTIVTFHHSVFSVAHHATQAGILARREALAPVFSEAGVDVVLMGHDHVYVRSFLMDGTTPSRDRGELAGDLEPEEGEVLYLTANSSSASKFYSIKDRKFAYAAVRNQSKRANFTNVEVTDDVLTLTTYVLSGAAANATVSVLDRVALSKPDREAPSITAAATAAIARGGGFDPLEGVSASDARDGDLTAALRVSGRVLSSIPGEYRLVYAVSDAAGNTTRVLRTVSVAASSWPPRF
ncbi:metallophosphoesterase family protein [Arthrobacter ginkgonis]|uniref:Metallophosphoesterase family protein n=1 Tax=Arthrobacter ginkgonis TaxID=1630594 RepID=A0ABP7CS04_9MICC